MRALKMMKRRRFVTRFLLYAALLYLGSYFLLSLRGHYEPKFYGVIRGSDGELMKVPKGSSSYGWNPFGWSHFDPPAEDSMDLKVALMFKPLWILDTKLWHTDKSMEQLESGKYRVKNFFDFEELVYRDIEP